MKVAIVDYGMGNLHSVLKSVQAAQVLSKQNAEVYLTSQPEEVMAADKVIFPGQGAMPDCMSALKASGLGEAVSDGLKKSPSQSSSAQRRTMRWRGAAGCSSIAFVPPSVSLSAYQSISRV